MRALILALLILILSPAQTAWADWVKARSENFIFVGDTTPKTATELLEDFEEFRSIIFELMQIPVSQELVPLKIYAVKSLDDVASITGHKYFSGVYAPRREGPVLIVNLKDIGKKDSRSRQTAYHEFSHHIIATYTNNISPRWYNEGFAEYLSTFKIGKDNRVTIGLPNDKRGNRLKSEKWIDFETVLNAVRQYPKGRKTRLLFYSQSWLSVHFILSNPEYSKKYLVYQKLLTEGESSLMAFQNAFEMTPNEFGDLLRAYFKANKYRTVSITLETESIAPNIAVKSLSKGEEYFHRGEATRLFQGSIKGYDAAERHYQKSEQNSGPEAQIAASRALLNIAKDENAATQYIAKAIEISPDDDRILQIAGHVKLRAFKNEKTPSNPDQIQSARKHLKQAMRANPQNLQAHFDYVSTYAATADDLSKQAVYSAKQCANYYKHRNFLNGNMRLVKVFDQAGESAASNAILEKAKLWARSKKVRTQAAERLSQTK